MSLQATRLFQFNNEPRVFLFFYLDNCNNGQADRTNKRKEKKEKAKSTAEFATKNNKLRFRLTEKISALKRASNNNNNNNNNR